MRRTLITGCLALALLAPAAMAKKTDLWMHVKVQDGDEIVRVNLPLSLVEAMLPAIQVDELRDGRLRIDAIDSHGWDEIDLRELWRAINDMGDADFLTIDGDHEQVRVFKEGDELRLDMAEHGDQRVKVRIPLEVVGALFSGEPGELDLLAAIEALGRNTGSDLVTVEDGRSLVRVWIDDRPTID